MDNTKVSLNKMEETQKVSEDLVNYMKNKLNEEFNKNILKYGMEKLNLQEERLNNLKSGYIYFIFSQIYLFFFYFYF